MNLALDVGNTNIKFGLFNGHDLIESGQSDIPYIEELIENTSIRHIILSSTRDLDDLNWIHTPSDLIIMDHTLKFPFTIEYQTPQTLGRDRIAAVAATWHRFPKENSLVIDAGTCITYDLIKSNGQYLGGNISPGLHMRLRAMNRFTDQLPLVDVIKPKSMIGRSTTEALQCGGIGGAIKEVQGFVQYYKKRFDNLNIVLTGGDAPFFVNSLKSKIFVDSILVLRGLNAILQYNVQ